MSAAIVLLDGVYAAFQAYETTLPMYVFGFHAHATGIAPMVVTVGIRRVTGGVVLQWNLNAAGGALHWSAQPEQEISGDDCEPFSSDSSALATMLYRRGKSLWSHHLGSQPQRFGRV